MVTSFGVSGLQYNTIEPAGSWCSTGQGAWAPSAGGRRRSHYRSRWTESNRASIKEVATSNSIPAFGSLGPAFRAVVCAVVPEAAALDAAGWREVETLVDRALRLRRPALRRRLRAFLRLVEYLPLLRWGHRFSELDPKRRDRFLRGLQNSRIRLARVGFWGLRTVALLGYYGRQAAAEDIGYRPKLKGWEAAG